MLCEQFRKLPVRGGKVLALDEAHKFMSGIGSDSDGLSAAIVNLVRLMRHDGMRVVVSTQSPTALAPELLELISVAVMHRFHSQAWYEYLSKRLVLPDDCFQSITRLQPGQALVFASRAALDDSSYSASSPVTETATLPVCIRRRITADRGSTRSNRPTANMQTSTVRRSAAAGSGTAAESEP